MKISPIHFGENNIEKASSANGYMPATNRYNSLSDMDFYLIAEKIRCQNFKNQMDMKLMNLKRKVNSGFPSDIYQKN